MAVRLLDDVVREAVGKIVGALQRVHHADQHFVVQALMADDGFRVLLDRAATSEQMYGKCGRRLVERPKQREWTTVG